MMYGYTFRLTSTKNAVVDARQQFLYLCYSLGSVRDFDWVQIGTVMSRLSRGRQLLRAQLKLYAAQAGILQPPSQTTEVLR
jgi:hypothetical protein